VVTASVEELHVKLQQAAQGMSASRGSRNSKQGNLREAQVPCLPVILPVIVAVIVAHVLGPHTAPHTLISLIP
jgi:hypothetical protein